MKRRHSPVLLALIVSVSLSVSLSVSVMAISVSDRIVIVIVAVCVLVVTELLFVSDYEVDSVLTKPHRSFEAHIRICGIRNLL